MCGDLELELEFKSLINVLPLIYNVTAAHVFVVVKGQTVRAHACIRTGAAAVRTPTGARAIHVFTVSVSQEVSNVFWCYSDDQPVA